MAVPTPTLISPIQEDLTNQLIGSFKDLISQGVLPPGAKLPPERELAQKFGVSRSTLRHALKVLSMMGVLTQRVGDGTYLNATAAGIFAEPMAFLMLLDGISLFEVLETRLIVEPELAWRAAERATADELAELVNSLDRMKTEKDQTRLIELDMAFHQAIFRASGNRLCDRIFTMIHKSMLTSVALTSQLVDWDHTISFHRPIYESIRDRNPAAARQKMIDHLTDAHSLLVRVARQTQAVRLPDAIRPVRKTGRARGAEGAADV